MKAARIHEYGGPEVLRIEQVPPPTIGPRDVLVEVHATSVNPVDCKIRSGGQRMIVWLKLPWILGLDVSGVVVEVGHEVTRFVVGDAVYGTPTHRRPGTYAELVAVAEAELAHRPAGLDHAQAASLPLVGLTAWQSLVVSGQLTAGQRVLILGGSGGVGTLAIQLAKHLGAEVTATCSPRNEALVRGLGADHVIDYHDASAVEALRGQDLVVDAAGGQATEQALPSLRRGGRLVSLVSDLPGRVHRLGLVPGTLATLGWMIGVTSRARLARGVRVHHVVRSPSGARLEELARVVASGAVRAVIDQTFPLDDIAQAHRTSEEGHARGKIVVIVRDEGAPFTS